MKQERDLSLLRPFNLEAARAGALLSSSFPVVNQGEPLWKYAAGPDSRGEIVVTSIDTNNFVEPATPDCFRMAPLCWVEDKPVYPGDELWYKGSNCGLVQSMVVTQMNPRDDGKGIEGRVLTCNRPDHAEVGELTWAPTFNWTWEKPKEKKEAWINIYPHRDVISYRYKTEEEAKYNASNDVVDTIRIEWEE